MKQTRTFTGIFAALLLTMALACSANAFAMQDNTTQDGNTVTASHRAQRKHAAVKHSGIHHGKKYAHHAARHNHAPLKSAHRRHQ